MLEGSPSHGHRSRKVNANPGPLRRSARVAARNESTEEHEHTRTPVDNNGSPGELSLYSPVLSTPSSANDIPSPSAGVSVPTTGYAPELFVENPSMMANNETLVWRTPSPGMETSDEETEAMNNRNNNSNKESQRESADTVTERSKKTRPLRPMPIRYVLDRRPIAQPSRASQSSCQSLNQDRLKDHRMVWEGPPLGATAEELQMWEEAMAWIGVPQKATGAAQGGEDKQENQGNNNSNGGSGGEEITINFYGTDLTLASSHGNLPTTSTQLMTGFTSGPLSARDYQEHDFTTRQLALRDRLSRQNEYQTAGQACDEWMKGIYNRVQDNKVKQYLINMIGQRIAMDIPHITVSNPMQPIFRYGSIIGDKHGMFTSETTPEQRMKRIVQACTPPTRNLPVRIDVATGALLQDLDWDCVCAEARDEAVWMRKLRRFKVKRVGILASSVIATFKKAD